jgi:hypothetical protein
MTTMPHIEAADPGGCPCNTPPAPDDLCVCDRAERTLRCYIRGGLPPMTPAQREECLAEIGSVEGYDRNDYEGVDDASLARGVLHAWTDFCRDTGLL